MGNALAAARRRHGAHGILNPHRSYHLLRLVFDTAALLG